MPERFTLAELPVTRRQALRAGAVAVGGTALGGLLAGCGGERSPTSAEGAGALGPNEKVTIDYWIGLGPDSTKATRTLVDGFRRAKPNITVNFKSYGQYGPLNTALQAALAARRPPALANIGFSDIAFAAEFFPHVTIEDQLKAVLGDRAEGYLSDTFAPEILALGNSGGVQHLLPFLIGTPYLFYNRDAYAEAGLSSPPATWPELREHAGALTKQSGRASFSIPEKGYFWAYQSLVESNGALVLTEQDGRQVTQIDQPEAAEALQFMADMIRKDKSAAYLEEEQGGASYQSGTLPMLTGFSSQVAGAVDGGRFRVGTAPLPLWEGKERRIPVAGNGFMFFNVDAKQRAAAWQLVEFMLRPDSLLSWTAATGYPPTRKGLLDTAPFQGFYEENPLFNVDIQQLEDVVPWVSFPGKDGPKALEELSETRDRIYVGQDTRTVLGNAAKRINELIADA